ncbi:unnamed protein product, partial [Heterosigma akashiwo]
QQLSTPFHFAACNGCAKVIQFLFAAGANHEAKDRQGATPLDLAIASGHNQAAQQIIVHSLIVDSFLSTLSSDHSNNNQG